MTIASWLNKAEAQLHRAGSPSARLDAVLLLADALEKPKTWLVAHNNEALPRVARKVAKSNLARRLKREPMAYIRGKQAFYGRDFVVNKNVLIPRPETETIISILKGLPLASGDILFDVGTGSGCIAITAKLEQPELYVYGLDLSRDALKLAQHNAKQLQAAVTFGQANLLASPALPPRAAVITANLPYVDPAWEVSPETTFEPKLALFAEQRGLELINALLQQAPFKLRPKGHLLLEADPRQHHTIVTMAQSRGFLHQQNNGFIVQLRT